MDSILWVMMAVFISMALLCFVFIAIIALEFFQEIKQYKADRRKLEEWQQSNYHDFINKKERTE